MTNVQKAGILLIAWIIQYLILAEPVAWVWNEVLVQATTFLKPVTWWQAWVVMFMLKILKEVKFEVPTK